MKNYNPFSLSGKMILVTGASSGIGQATAIEASRLGAELFITGRDEQRLDATGLKLACPSLLKMCADFTIDDDIERIVEQSPMLDGLVLCPGKGLTLPFLFSTKEKFRELIEINLLGPIELFRCLAKKKKLKSGASVVIVSSIGGTYAFKGVNSIYGATKAAISAIMRYAAIELSPRSIRVNAVNPGMVDTPLIHRGQITEQQLVDNAAQYPLRRFGRPEDIAYGIIYLLSNASSWVTGQTLIIDGGISI